MFLPLLFGKYYVDDVERNTLGQPIYQDPKKITMKNTEKGEYEKLNPTRCLNIKIIDSFLECTVLIRAPITPGYQNWVHNPNDIKFSDNLKFFFKYQIGWSYMRYFFMEFRREDRNDIINMDGTLFMGTGKVV